MLFVVVSYGSVDATAIIKIINTDILKILVAADSKELRLEENKNPVALITCKIARTEKNALGRNRS